MADSISLELALHCIALNSPDARYSIKKLTRGRRQSYHGQCNWWQAPLESHWMQTEGSPRCAAILKFHARVYSYNCERSPTLQVTVCQMGQCSDIVQRPFLK